MTPSHEIEPKPSHIDGASRPLSWGEREEQQRLRSRASKPGPFMILVNRILSKTGRVSRSIGLTRRKIEINGVVYRERNTTSLRRALSPTGSGVKEYDVQFPAWNGTMPASQYPMRESMRIRYTHKRMYADLGHEPRVQFFTHLTDLVRPGDRVLELGCGTGGGSAVLATMAGPSGGAIAIHRDGESIRYARQRYRADQLAFELGWLETLDGELDGAFDVVVAVDLFRDAPDEPSKSRAIASLWRVLSPGGVALVMTRDRNRLDEQVDRLGALGAQRVDLLPEDPILLWGGAIAQRPEPKPVDRDSDRATD